MDDRQDVWLSDVDVQVPHRQEGDGQQDEKQGQHKVDLQLAVRDIIKDVEEGLFVILVGGSGK